MDINKISQSDKSHKKLFSKTPLCTFIVCSIVLKFLSTFRGNHLLMKQMAYITSYITLSLLLMMVASFFKDLDIDTIFRPKSPIKDTLGAKKASTIPLKFLHKLKKNQIHKSDTSGCEAQKQDNPFPSAKNENRNSSNRLYTITETTSAGNTQKHNKLTTKRQTVLAILYFLFQFLLAAFFFQQALKTPYLYLVEQEVYSFLHVVVMLFVACAFFLTNKWFLQDENANANKTIAGYAIISGIVSLAFALILTINIMFGTTVATILLWISRLTLMYFSIITAVSVLLSALKQELLSNFNYSILPFMGKEYASTSVFDVLKDNTGISLKSLWSLRYIATIFPGILLGCVLLLFVSTSFFIVNSHEKAAIYSFGKLDESSIVGEGFHVKLPWPIQKVEVLDVTRTKQLQIGYESSETKDFLWSKTHDGGEYYLLLGNGNELMCVNIKILYTINDLYSYLTKTANPEEFLSSKAYEIMMNRTVTTTLDKLLSIDRSSLSNSIGKELKRFSKEQELGINVTNVIIESIHPPVEIAEVYQNVVNAQIAKSTRVSKAQSTAFRTIADAELESTTTITKAKGEQTTKISDANYEMAVYLAAMEAYTISPNSFKLDKYLNTYEKIIGNNRVYVFSPKVDLDLSSYIINNRSEDDLLIVKQ